MKKKRSKSAIVCRRHGHFAHTRGAAADFVARPTAAKVLAAGCDFAEQAYKFGHGKIEKDAIAHLLEFCRNLARKYSRLAACRTARYDRTIVLAADGIPRKAHHGRKAGPDSDVRTSKRGFLMMPKSRISRLGALITLALIVAPPVSMVHAVWRAHKVSVVSFGLFGDQGVFRSEATGAAQVVAGRFGRGPIDVEYNSKKGGAATIQGLARALHAATSGLNADNDVLFLILTSHGSPDGLAIKAGRVTQLLTPANLAGMLISTGVRHKVVVISACYSGVFIPRLANPDVLVITAADAVHPSFGCQDKAKWTYFGDAFFNVALRHAKSLKDAFVLARALVRKHELREHFEPSHPLMAGGANVQSLLIAQP